MSAVVRFTPSERAWHWVFAAGWLALLASGLPLMLPAMQGWIRGYSPVIGLRLHLAAAVVWAVALAGVLLLGFPATRPSLSGMLRGRVSAEWAARHHPRWRAERAPEDRAA